MAKASSQKGNKSAPRATAQSEGKESQAKISGAGNKSDAQHEATDWSQAAKPIAALSEDHRRVEKLFESYKTADSGTKRRLVREICKELVLHTMLEEEVFYPACRDAFDTDESLDTAQVEHDTVKQLITDLQQQVEADDPWRDAKVSVLEEQIRHHVEEEEKPQDGIFAQAVTGGVATDDLAQRLTERKQALQGRAGELMPSRAISLTTGKENDMARYDERDERGRFRDDDDDRGGRGRGRGGWFGDSEGHSRAARSRDDDDDRGRRSSSRGDERRYDDDDGRGHGRGGWFGDSEGHSRAARSRDDDDDRGRRSSSRGDDRRYDDDDDGRGHGRGGWFGDSEGHSEASRRGWDNPRHGPSGWYGDSRGHAEASRRGWDNPRHGPSGWYGDSEGHSRAARMRDDDDDRRSTRGRYDDDRRSSGSRSRDDDDGRGHGRGGWFGDSRGHSEASRRGWERR